MTDSFNREGFITTDKIYLNRVWLWSIETFIFLINEPFNKGTSFYAVHLVSQSQRENVENAKISGYIAPVKKRIKEKLNQNI